MAAEDRARPILGDFPCRHGHSQTLILPINNFMDNASFCHGSRSESLLSIISTPPV
ncbi:hypothetical protein B0H19DRAFT_1162305 [Mycena capillaripes]|nr:hypothetical protein B0H19DRAFT_1162305 [Mycena capillaripes]